MSFIYPYVIFFYLLALPLIYRVYRKSPEPKERRKILLLSFVLFLILVAFARPVAQKGVQEVENLGTEIVIAIDLSASMKADDITPTRLDRARTLLKSLVERSPKDKFAIIGFTSSAIILSPMTDDKALLMELFDRVNGEHIVSKSTDLASVFELADKLTLLENKQLVIFTDGAEGSFEEQIAFAKERAIHVYTVGMATDIGASLKSDRGEIIVDDKGEIVISALNPELRVIADATQGEFYRYSDDMGELLEAIHAQAAMQTSRSKEIVQVQLFYLPLALALILFMLASTSILSRYIAVVLLSFPATDLQAGVFDFFYLYRADAALAQADYERSAQALESVGDKNWQTLYNLGYAYFKAGEYAQARFTFSRIKTTDPKRKAALLYNIANCFAQEQLYTKAAEYYRQSLILDDKPETRDNLLQVSLLKDKKEMPEGLNQKKATEDTMERKANSKGGKKKESQNENASQQGKSTQGAGKTKMSSKKRTLQSTRREDVGLSPKQYTQINKGSYSEKNPW